MFGDKLFKSKLYCIIVVVLGSVSITTLMLMLLNFIYSERFMNIVFRP